MTAVNSLGVFINCPFDDEYKPIFNAILFSILDLGFEAVHSFIDEGGEPVRLNRIVGAIKKSKYSIHDLSRVEINKAKLPRFNMPFEAGVAFCLQHDATPGSRHFLLLDSKPYRYQASLSDVAGLDPKIHEGKPKLAVDCVSQFLSARSLKSGLPGPEHTFARFSLFWSVLPDLAGSLKYSMAEVDSWNYATKLQVIMSEWIQAYPP